jgi:predicted ATPase
MRIAISGTHCTGKSTLIDEFLQAHKDFVHEPEPYTVLVEDFGEEFSAEPCVADFYRQLEFNIERLRQHERGARVIYERCPIDFLAYIDALDSQAAQASLGLVSDAIQNLDLVVYLPLEDAIDVPDEEYPKLRQAVDRRLSAIFSEDELGIISSSELVVVEAKGSTKQRLRIIEEALTFQT